MFDQVEPAETVSAKTVSPVATEETNKVTNGEIISCISFIRLFSFKLFMNLFDLINEILFYCPRFKISLCRWSFHFTCIYLLR